MLRFSRMMNLGTAAPDFKLPDGDGILHSLRDMAGARALMVVFTCNHCPFALHVMDGLVQYANDYAPRGVRVVAISSNDVITEPDDTPELMAKLARERGFAFPYLYDASQQVAIAYGAICTPDFFLFDTNRNLVYRGQFDASRPDIGKPPLPGAPKMRFDLPVTGDDLRRATDALLTGLPIPEPQLASAGCGIKWIVGNEPEWA